MRRARLSLMGAALVTLLLSADARLSASHAQLAVSPGRSTPAVSLRAATGATTEFRERNGTLLNGVAARTSLLPRLVLRRNGLLTSPSERTLLIELSGLPPHAGGATLTLEIETQHIDPDQSSTREPIVVWREPHSVAELAETLVSTITFGANLDPDLGSAPMPTDYFRLRLSAMGEGKTGSSVVLERDHAFLMESQWITRLPGAREESDGAAPDELIVYFCDMFPFQRDRRDDSARLSRSQVADFVRATLVPRMAEAFETQSGSWGLVWHDAWTSYRPGADAHRLSVALTDGRTWYHGEAPVTGHSAISLNTNGPEAFAAYDTLADALVSTFHHELFHNLQRSINQYLGGDGNLDAGREAWGFFSEGTAFLASSVGLPSAHFGGSKSKRRHMANANSQIAQYTWGAGAVTGIFGASYWRFLYEMCGGMTDGIENPGHGMAIVHNALGVLYGGDIVDIASSGDLLSHLPRVMDQALADTPSCPFRTFDDSIMHFSRAIYALRVEGGRCIAPGLPVGCELYDPNGLYDIPPVGTMQYAGEAERLYHAAVRRSYGMAFVDITLDPAANGRPLVLELQGNPGDDTSFGVQVWRMRGLNPVAATQALTHACPGGHLVYVVPEVDAGEWDRLGVIITRLDANERPDEVGGYTIRLRAGGTLCQGNASGPADFSGYMGAEVIYPEVSN